MDGVHPSLLERKIVHVDMDAFYAAVEILDNPSLAGKPLVVGGPPNSRSVVCTASYEARRFGIRSALPCSQAQRLCPQAVFVPPRFERYHEVSRAVQAIFRRYTHLVEPMSLDEAYLDVTENSLNAYAYQVAQRIKADIHGELGLTASAGVAPNKLVAKIASDFRKPNGLVVVRPAEVEGFMADLGVRKINGIGPATEKRLQAVGIVKCRDVWNWTRDQLRERLGSTGEWLFDASRGVDVRPVETQWERKSIGREETLARDVTDVYEIGRLIDELARDVGERLSRRRLQGRMIQLKVKYADFTSVTRRTTMQVPTADSELIANAARSLIGRTEAGTRPVRLVGVQVGGLEGDVVTAAGFEEND